MQPYLGDNGVVLGIAALRRECPIAGNIFIGWPGVIDNKGGRA